MYLTNRGLFIKIIKYSLRSFLSLTKNKCVNIKKYNNSDILFTHT